MTTKRVTVATIVFFNVCVFAYENIYSTTNNGETKQNTFQNKKMFNFIANKGSFKNFKNGSYPEKFTCKLSENNKILHWLNAQYI